MARTKQTARKSTGGKAPRKQLATKACRKSFKCFMTSQQSVGAATFGSGPQKTKTSFINHENTMGEFLFPCGPREAARTFVPRYTVARSLDPVTGNEQQWLGVNFLSKYDDDGIAQIGRPPLQLCLVIDISGSMSCSFDSADGGWGGYNTANSKMAVAKRCVKAIVQQLDENDSISIILFNHETHTLVPLTSCKALNRAEVDAKIDGVQTRGGTNLEQGFQAGMDMLAGGQGTQKRGAKKKGGARKKGAKAPAAGTTAGAAGGEQELKRVMFITDMQSSLEDEAAVLDIARENAASVHTTIVGVGVDLSVGTVQTLSGIPGCKYSSVASAEEFEGKIATDFPCDVTPTASHITVTLGDGYAFDKGFGSPEMNGLASGATSFAISSEFPIMADAQRNTLGGLYVFKLRAPAAAAPAKGKGNGKGKGRSKGKRAAPQAKAEPGSMDSSADAGPTLAAGEFRITAAWTQMDGQPGADAQVVGTCGAPDDLGVKKAIALVRYVDLQSEYVLDDDADTAAKPGASRAEVERELASHHAWIQRFKDERALILREMRACGDDSIEHGNNKNVLDTINQIIGIEEAEVKRVQKEFKAALRVKQAEARSAAALSSASSSSASAAGADTYPNEFLCSITSGLMIDPVMTSDGQTYERAAIEEWFARHPTGRVKSPNTNKYLANRNLVPNIALRRLIQDHVAEAEAGAQRGAKRGRRSGAGAGANSKASAAAAAPSKASAPAARKRRARSTATAPLTPIPEVANQRRTRAQAAAACN